MHWYLQQITIHSGILFDNGNKSYRPYISVDKKHNQKLARIVMDEMVNSNSSLPDVLIIESDNCYSQYKSAEHYHDLQQIADDKNVTIIRSYSIAGHGKGELDHVGGMMKVAIRCEIAAGKFLYKVSYVGFSSKKK